MKWLFIILATPCFAASWLQWDFESDPGVINYQIYAGTNSRNYSSVTNFGNVNKVLLPRLRLQPGDYFIAITAINDAGYESAFSEEVTYTVPPRAIPVPITNIVLRVPSGKFYVEASQNLLTWTASATVNGPTNINFTISNANGFFRYRSFFLSASPAKSGKLVASKPSPIKTKRKPSPAKTTVRQTSLPTLPK